MELNTKEDLLNVISELIENDKAREEKLQTLEQTISSIGSNSGKADDQKDPEEHKENDEQKDPDNLSDEKVDELTQLLIGD